MMLATVSSELSEPFAFREVCIKFVCGFLQILYEGVFTSALYFFYFLQKYRFNTFYGADPNAKSFVIFEFEFSALPLIFSKPLDIYFHTVLMPWEKIKITLQHMYARI